MKTSCRVVAAWAGLMAVTGSAGCSLFSSAPREIGVDQVLDEENIHRWADEFWEALNVPAVTTRDPKLGTRTAIVEFSVSYVSAQTGARALQAVGHQGAPAVSSDLRRELPEVLCRAFVRTLPYFNRHNVPLKTVSEAAAYRDLLKLASNPPPEGGAVAWYGTPGLPILDPSDPTVEAALQNLIRELAIDSVLRIRLRVGLRAGRPALEDGSICRVTTIGGTGVLQSKAILVSDTVVTEADRGSDATAPVTIQTNEFLGAIERLFRPYISMALVVARG